MKGIIVTHAARNGWGFIESNGENFFFHVKNSPNFQPVLGQNVEFELAPPFKLGQRDQAVNLRCMNEGTATPKAGA